jgi:hypothetical protein
LRQKRRVRHEADKVKVPHSTSVLKAMQAKYDPVVALTDTFCRDHLKPIIDNKRRK